MYPSLPAGLFPQEKYIAFIFDLDGTLVDSSAALYAVYEQWCREKQLDLNTVLSAFRGSRVIDHLPHLAPHLDAKLEATHLGKLEVVTTTGIVAIEGSVELLQIIQRKNIRWAIATSCSLPVAQLRLRTAGLPEPEIFVTSEQVTHGKPNPEHFLKTAAQLQLIPEHCLVFEDSNNGVQAALDAGCDVIVVGEACAIEHPNIIARISNYVSIVKMFKKEAGVPEVQ